MWKTHGFFKGKQSTTRGFSTVRLPNVLKIAIYTGENEGFQHQNLGASKFQTNLNGCDWTGF
jgi:hypothetical protein